MDQPSSMVDRRLHLRPEAVEETAACDREKGRDVACYISTMRAIGRLRAGGTLPASYCL